MPLQGDQALAAEQRGARSFWKRWLLGGVILFLGLIVVGALAYDYFCPRQISSAGGLYFFSSLKLNVLRFGQSDPRWGEQPLGPSPTTMAQEGCAVTSAAMVLNFYGVAIDPGKLNSFLSNHAGYTPQGWLYWEAAAAYQPGVAEKAYEGLPSYFLIDNNLLHGNPVIVRVHLPSGITHFVVIVGKLGFRYLIQDPAAAGETGVYPLENLAPKIEALRYYRTIKNQSGK